MKSFLKKYDWLWYILVAVIFLVCGILLVINSSLLLLILGAFLLVFGIVRVYPTIKVFKSSHLVVRIFRIIEVVANIAVGVILLVEFSSENGVFGISENSRIAGYFIGGTVYYRAFVYFLTSTFSVNGVERKDKISNNAIIEFLLHIALITVGAIIIGNGGFSFDQLAWFTFGLLMLIVLVVAIIASVKTTHYFKNNKPKKEENQEKVDVYDAEIVEEETPSEEEENPKELEKPQIEIEQNIESLEYNAEDTRKDNNE